MALKVVCWAALSSLIVSTAALSHEVNPSVADFTVVDGLLSMDISISAEAMVAGVDLSALADTNESDKSNDYDVLRALSDVDLAQRFREIWPELVTGFTVTADGQSVDLELSDITVPPVGNVELPRPTEINVIAQLPDGAKQLIVGWNKSYGTLILRQLDVEAPYTGFLAPGVVSEAITIAGGGQQTGWAAFFEYIPVGFDHIVPKGLDHILFVLGLFFLSTQLRPLLWQVTAFTLAHTVTLAMGALGWVSIPGSIVEPLIAASIVFVAVENIFAKGLNPWRPFIIFGFGLLHGLGFASVLGDFGLPTGGFIPALIGFNIGVEIGQLAVIAAAFFAVGLWFRNKPWYRTVIAIPASVGIAIIGAGWFVERVFDLSMMPI
ncbi:HupE/UreJ family protein [Algirhabdus cladophorae]|uniref:HupE/UreJ family protein n=1 Tax=Algirhabdus cladophorae TaxID=3377108 RepID=UPI003B84A760